MCPTLPCLTLPPYPCKILLNKCSAPPTPSVSMRLPSVNRVACSCGSRSHLQEQNLSMYFCNFGGSLSLNHLNIRQTQADWGIRFNLSSFSIITQFWGYFLQSYGFYTKVYMNCTKFLLIILSRNLTHYLFSLSYLFLFLQRDPFESLPLLNCPPTSTVVPLWPLFPLTMLSIHAARTSNF